MNVLEAAYKIGFTACAYEGMIELWHHNVPGATYVKPNAPATYSVCNSLVLFAIGNLTKSTIFETHAIAMPVVNSLAAAFGGLFLVHLLGKSTHWGALYFEIPKPLVTLTVGVNLVTLFWNTAPL